MSALDESLPDGTNLHEFDLYDYNASLLADATALGFTNTTDPCFIAAPESAATNPGCGVDGANIASYVYWNDIHPTARVQALWAAGFESGGSRAVDLGDVADRLRRPRLRRPSQSADRKLIRDFHAGLARDS